MGGVRSISVFNNPVVGGSGWGGFNIRTLLLYSPGTMFTGHQWIIVSVDYVHFARLCTGRPGPDDRVGLGTSTNTPG